MQERPLMIGNSIANFWRLSHSWSIFEQKCKQLLAKAQAQPGI